MIITSRTNDAVKRVRALHLAKERKETGLHLIEGDKLVLDAIQSGAEIMTVFATEDYEPILGVDWVCVSRPVMEAMCESNTPQHLLATVKTPCTACPNSYPEGLILVLDGLQDVGNVGTIIRTSDALGATAVLLSNDAVDPFSPKCVRASMGSSYHLPVWRGDLEQEIDKLKQQGFSCLCGHLKGETGLVGRSLRTALVVGNEGNGVRKSIADRCHKFKLEQKGKAESLNAAIFAAIIMYELLK
ncbi:MAG: RNA methyltransferase [Eubacteriales bacterium]|nr:RNA methyltransferase [Eubacteriales bacterium]